MFYHTLLSLLNICCLKTKNKTDIGPFPFYPLGTEATNFQRPTFPENIKELEVNKQTRFPVSNTESKKVNKYLIKYI